MAFLSVEFIGFFFVVLFGFFLIPGRWQWGWLLVASTFFYSMWNPLLLVHALAVIGATYWIALRIEDAAGAEGKRIWTRFGILLLIANLFVFKYTAFVSGTVRKLFESVGFTYPVPDFHILLPIGISFYTFQLIGYLVDTHKGAKAERHLGIFALFTLFFAKVVSGPIERGKTLLPQLHTVQTFDADRVAAGLRLALWGAFQKLVIADQLAPAVAIGFDAPHSHGGPVLAASTWFFAFQLYFDFAGYTNIARGLAQTLGYTLLPNFNRPYFATSIPDFWRRWHISLTTWLTDYVYNPLVRVKIRMKWFYWTLCSLLITFVISGLWHGAGWTFVAWGALHGIYLVTSALTQKWRTKLYKRIGLLRHQKVHAKLKMATTFLLVCVAYVLFRVNSGHDAVYVFTHLHTGWAHPISTLLDDFNPVGVGIAIGLTGVAVAMAAEMFPEKSSVGVRLAHRPGWVRWVACCIALVAILLLGALGNSHNFIYVRF